MPSSPTANYKRIQCFLATAEPKTALQRLFLEDAQFVIGDPTEIERRRASHPDYVGVLKDGKTRGFWLLPQAVPFRGRAIPLVLYATPHKLSMKKPIRAIWSIIEPSEK